MSRETKPFLSDIRFHAPETLKEALRLLHSLEGARVMAGGTDLLVDLKQGLIDVQEIISLQKLEELKDIGLEDDKIRIGALVTPKSIMTHPLINEHLPALSEAASSLAAHQIRTMATIGGNIASAVPSADLPPSLIAAEAAVELRCLDSSREESLAEFFTGPRETCCTEGEILTFITIPVPPANTGISYQKFTLREANALAVASVAARLTLEGSLIQKASVILGAVAPTPLLAVKASQILVGYKPSEELFRQAASQAQQESRPISDIRGSIWFRETLVGTLTQRALKEALQRAQGASERGA